jgi:hypothetical protein
MADEEKKIIVDEDWKAQAQKEKETLKEQEKEEHDKEAEKKPNPGLRCRKQIFPDWSVCWLRRPFMHWD